MGRFSSKESVEETNAIGNLNYLKAFEEVDIGKRWIEPENRKELFNRYFRWRVLSHDLDHTHYMSKFCENYSFEQKAWYAFCFGMTYRTPQAFAYTETFETPFHVTEEWHAANWQRTTYGTDARYNKGHFVKQTDSVKQWLNGKTFEQKFNSILVYDNERQNFWALYKEVLSLYKYGRMTGWLTMQALYDLLKLKIDPGDIMLDGYSPSNDSSLGSIWNGLCALENKPNMMVGKYGNYTPSDKDVQWSKELLLEHTKEAERYSGFKIDSFRCESIWCQYKRLFNEGVSKEYPGHASGDATSRYMYYRENWQEIDWSSFRQALREQPGVIKGMTFVDWFNGLFGKTGILMNMHELYDDMPNGYKLLNIDPMKYKVKEIWTDDGLDVPTTYNFKQDLIESPKYYENIIN
jgi:hypothetical protein